MACRSINSSNARLPPPLRTFGDLAGYDLEATLSCRCGRQATLDGQADDLRDRPIGVQHFRCTTLLPHGRPCLGRHVPSFRKRGREGWHLPEHWQAMRDRHPATMAPDRIRTFRDHVHAGHIAWLHDTGCPAGYMLPLVALDEPPWDRFLDRPVGPIACPTCRKALRVQIVEGGRTSGGLPAEPRPLGAVAAA